MALDQAYFDAIKIDLVKRKYYNANKVEAVLEDIRRQALLLNRENELLGRQLYALHGQKDEIGDALLSAKTIAQQIIADAQAQAEKILGEARRLSREMTDEAERDCRETREETEAARRELAQRIDGLEQTVRVRLLSLMDEVCTELRSYSGAADSDDQADEAAPADLSDKVGAIARELEAIDEGE
ncbi:MAG: DivIVA domain-containing protein [Clostridia bacterium]